MTARIQSNVWIDWQCLHELSGPAVHRLIRFRESIFVVEQVCAYQQADGFDERAWHARLFRDENLVDCLRLLPPSDTRAVVIIGRVAIALTHRRQGPAGFLMEAAMDFGDQHSPGHPIDISAQTHLTDFYGALGFSATTGLYLEDGIPRVCMRHTLKKTRPLPEMV